MPTVPPSNPGEFHLYPHIHGSPGLHGLSSRSHMRPLLQPQLYDLHLPMRQPKSIIQPKVPLKLDFDSPDGIHDHINHAYGDWDNTYDSRVLLPKYGTGLSTELLPPPPLSSLSNPFAPITPNFLTEPYQMSALTTIETTMSTASTTTSASKTTINTSQAPASSVGQLVKLFPQFLEPSLEPSLDAAINSATTNLVTSKEMTPPCSRPATLGGNNSQQVAPLNSSQSPKLAQKPALPTSDKPHTQHCKRHMMGKGNLPQNFVHSSSINTTTTSSVITSSTSTLPVKVTQDFIQTAARNIREGAKEGMQMIRQFANSLNANVSTTPHVCNNHTTTCSNSAINHLPNPPNMNDQHTHSPNCQYSVSVPATVSNVSVGTSTGCINNTCGADAEDACDSVSDSCSEQSSTTSNSNPKEGKYCDCCYCEFFGHGNVSTVYREYVRLSYVHIIYL